ncbi:hypothetical protein GOV13_03050 [Candidatus Pacearchaeota archaeon]|nr:hypothetical protein [Candidatus Pacearchaeota archaeon]
MANRNMHYIGGVIISIFGLNRLQSNGLMISDELSIILLLLGVLSSRLPDILEPPNGRHRKILHSYLVLVILVIVIGSIFNSLIIKQDDLLVLVFFILLGYTSHLLLDLPNLPVIN